MEKILPVLKPSSEFKLQSERGMYINRLMDFPESPFFMFGTDMGVAIAYTQNSNSNDENEKIKNQGIKNLKELEDINVSYENLSEMKIAIAQHEYAAEKILDIDFLKKISIQLNSKEIIIGIPVKGFFVAVAKDSDLLKFGAVVKKQFENPQQTYGITEYLFLVEDGQIVNVAKGIEKTENYEKKPWWKIW